MPSPYPNAYQLEEMFANRGVPSLFHTYLADNIDVTVVGQDFHIGGHHNSMEAFHGAIYDRVSAALKVETIRVELLRVIGGGESTWAAVESLCTATSKYDKPYHLEFMDLVRFNSQGKIAQMKKFLDSGHIQNHVVEHESKTKEAIGIGEAVRFGQCPLLAAFSCIVKGLTRGYLKDIKEPIPLSRPVRR